MICDNCKSQTYVGHLNTNHEIVCSKCFTEKNNKEVGRESQDDFRESNRKRNKE